MIPTTAEFLREIYRGFDPGSETPVLGKRLDSGGFVASRWPEGKIGGCEYASTGLQVPTADAPWRGGQSSKRANFTGGIALVLDDILEKVPAPFLKPSWIMQTKPGSEQWGYLFEEPLRGAARFDAMIRACCDAGVTDPGMRNIVRWFRIPAPPPPGKLHGAFLREFNPEQRFDPHDPGLLNALGVWQALAPRAFTPYTTPGAVQDAVYDWLEAAQGIKAHCSDGWIEVECPWGAAHSEGSSSAYYKPCGEGSPLRGFNCFHSHAGDGRPGLLAYLDWVHRSGGPQVQPHEAALEAADEAGGIDDLLEWKA